MPATSTNGIYRDASDELARRRDQLYEEQRRASRRLPSVLERVYSRRLARTFAGQVTVVGVGVALVLGFAEALWWFAGAELGLDAAMVGGALFAAWALGAISYVAVRLCTARGSLTRAVVAALHPTADVTADLDRLRRGVEGAAVGIIADRERAALVWPLAAAALALPLLIHYAVAALANGSLLGAAEYGEWVSLSAALVGHAHVVFALTAARYARELASGPEHGPSVSAVTAAFRAFCVALVPGVLLLGVPPVLALVTGLVIAPPLFAAARRTRARERRQLGLTP